MRNERTEIITLLRGTIPEAMLIETRKFWMQIAIFARTMPDGVKSKKRKRNGGKMTKQEFYKKIEEVKEEFNKKLDELYDIEIESEQPKRWKPEHKEIYYYVAPGGNVEDGAWIADANENTFDGWCYLTGNCFKTKKEAEEYKKQIEYTARYKNYIEEHSEPLDWNNDDQPKVYVEYWYEEKRIKIDAYVNIRLQGTIYASSEEIIWDAIEEIGEDNFKKYVLGVK